MKIIVEHANNKSEKQEIKSEEERKSLSLERAISTKIQCEFWGLFLSYGEVVEHEEIYGARTTNCKLCGQRLLYKNLDEHIISIHNIDKAVYKASDHLVLSKEISELDLNQNQNTSLNLNDYNNNNGLDLNSMTSSEQIALALALNDEVNKKTENNVKQNEKIVYEKKQVIKY